jgi:hypothetical protein
VPRVEQSAIEDGKSDRSNADDEVVREVEALSCHVPYITGKRQSVVRARLLGGCGIPSTSSCTHELRGAGGEFLSIARLPLKVNLLEPPLMLCFSTVKSLGRVKSVIRLMPFTPEVCFAQRPHSRKCWIGGGGTAGRCSAGLLVAAFHSQAFGYRAHSLQRLKFGVAFGAFARLDQPIFPFTPPTKSWRSDPCGDLHCDLVIWRYGKWIRSNSTQSRTGAGKASTSPTSIRMKNARPMGKTRAQPRLVTARGQELSITANTGI